MKIMISLECLADTTSDRFRDHLIGCFGKDCGLPLPDIISVWDADHAPVSSSDDLKSHWVVKGQGSVSGSSYTIDAGPTWKSTRAPKYAAELRHSMKDNRGRPVMGLFTLTSAAHAKADFDLFLRSLIDFDCQWEGAVFAYSGRFQGSTTVLHPTTRKITIRGTAVCLPASVFAPDSKTDQTSGTCRIAFIGASAIVYPMGSVAAFLAASGDAQNKAQAEAQSLADRIAA